MAEPMEKPFFKGIIVVKRLSTIGLALVKFKGCSRFVFTKSQWIEIVKNQNSKYFMHVHKILDQMAEPKEKPFFKGIIVVKRLSAIGLALVKSKGCSCFVFTQSQWIKLVKNQNSPTTDNENIGNKSSSCLDFDDCQKNLLELSWKVGSDG